MTVRRASPALRMSSSCSRLLYSLGAVLLLVACGRGSDPGRAAQNDQPKGRIVDATWNDVPADSLARRRAGEAELTAASDHFAIGALVQVTRVSNGKSVVVRITDNGLQKSASRIDLCAEAAERLGMIRKGVAKVKVTALPSARKSARP